MGRSVWRALAVLCAAAQGYAAGLTIAVTVTDSTNRPVPGIRVELRSEPTTNVLDSATTDVKGQASFAELEPRPYEMTIAKEGFETLRRAIDLTMGESMSV